MSKMRIVDPRLKKFQKAMRDRLALPENQDKPDWRVDLAIPAAALLVKHVTKLNLACTVADYLEALKACENIANYAFIIHDTASWIMNEASTDDHRRIIRDCLRVPDVHGTGSAILPPPCGPLDAPKPRRRKVAHRG